MSPDREVSGCGGEWDQIDPATGDVLCNQRRAAARATGTVGARTPSAGAVGRLRELVPPGDLDGYLAEVGLQLADD
jgi:hypothetical protein